MDFLFRFFLKILFISLFVMGLCILMSLENNNLLKSCYVQLEKEKIQSDPNQQLLNFYLLIIFLIWFKIQSF